MEGRLADLAGTAAGYLIGSIPVGVILGRLLRNTDVREHGSGSMGTTNVLRTVGPAAAGLTFALDTAKGAAAVAAARRLGAGEAGQAAAALGAMVGHSWPLFARFRGGKAVATAFGGILMISPTSAAFAVVGGLSTLAATRVVSVASLTSAASATVGAGVDSARSGDRVPIVFVSLAALLVTVRHIPNLRRLMRGEEPKVGD